MNTIAENWDTILLTMKKEYDISDLQFNTWIKPLTFHSVEDQVVTVVIPKELSKLGINYITNHYKIIMQVTISDLMGMDNCEVNFVSQEDIPEEHEIVKTYNEHVQDERFREANLNPKYTFDTFVVGSNNKFAQAAALAVAESPGNNYNPLFIYGGAGLGKTHLMHSIAHYIIEHNDDIKVLYVTSENFTNEVIDTIRSGSNTSMKKFRDKYRNVDVLLVDDIQFIIGKESTQEEFFHTFNSLHSAKKQIIISSDKPPKDMEILEERFRSRFEWGLIADITNPDYETRMAILHKKEEMDGCNAGEDVINYIAENIKSNIRELEGALNKVIAYSKLQSKEITLELAQKALIDMITPVKDKTVTMETILDEVADFYQISPEDILGTKRNSRYSNPRQVVMYLQREILGVPYKNIGQFLGGKDHSTVMHGIEKIDSEMKTNDKLRNDVLFLRKKLTPSG